MRRPLRPGALRPGALRPGALRSGALWSGGPALVAGALWALRRHRLVATVVGTSMLPAFRPGERVLVRRPAPDLRVGDVVVVVAPDSADSADPRLLVKRVAALPGDALPDGTVVPGRAVVVLGDNGGYDSRQFGPLPREQVVGVVMRRIDPRRRPPGPADLAATAPAGRPEPLTDGRAGPA